MTDFQEHVLREGTSQDGIPGICPRGIGALSLDGPGREGHKEAWDDDGEVSLRICYMKCIASEHGSGESATVNTWIAVQWGLGVFLGYRTIRLLQS